MTRRANRVNGEWATPVGDANEPFQWEHVSIEVLMDIREELRILNATLRCHRVWHGMDALVRIDKRLQKKISLRDKS